MLINGEKWACEACVRGHRVSNCQHHDRPLQHINKKGRPVSQCQHCRSMRKYRASHVKCDCGEKTSKCIHLQVTVEGHKESCCCNHGGRCTCCHKKEHPQLETVPESDSDKSCSSVSRSCSKSASRNRRRANTTNSDAMLSFDANGHHKPTYKHTKPSQKCGPYTLSRGNSMHSTTSSLGARSVDNLDVSGSGIAMQRGAQSESASPLMTGSSTFAQLNGQLPPLDLSGIKYTPYVPNSADFFGSLSDNDQPLFSAGLSATSVDWSHYEGLDLGNKSADFAPSSYGQAQSYGSFDYYGSESLSTLTTNTSTSGDISEVEDFLPALDDWETASGFCATTPGSGFGFGQPQPNLYGAADPFLDFEEFKMMKAGAKFLANNSSLTSEDSSLLTSNLPDFSNFPLEDDPAFWITHYGGLALQDPAPADGTVHPLWDGSS
ncbi:hypothetical protein B0H65DRAFT_221813 [Neurospora tetraspora]|uniref:Copper-fist domain-containing protein n=1 Tax=Neurospora tetraspora TaxID=94610 RepID=A0AAE0JCC6_9PEZI|nr:hypothetical protein B0H65DRAFT_221813 [Neurospora tetraspora]